MLTCHVTASQTWKMLMAPNAPSPRNNHSAAAYGSKLFIFGGFCDGAVLNDLYIFDTERNGWISLEAKGPKPPARCDATLTAVGNKLVLFGGASDGIWFNDVHVFDVDSRTWTQPRISGAVPPKRDYHSAAAVDRNVVVFGGTCEGENSSVLYNDVYLFNVDSGAWTKAVPSGSAPAARWGHSAVSYRGEVIVHGGCSTPSLIFNDVCVLDTSAADEPVPLPKPARSVGGAPAPAARPLPLPKGQPATPAPRPGAIATPLAGAGQAGGAPSPAARPGQGGSSASLANVNPASLKVTGGLQAPQPIPAGRPSYATHTPIPAPRKPAPSVKPRETTTKDYSEHLARSKASLQAIYTEVEGLFADLDAERAQLQADKAQFAEEKRMNQEQHDQQQSELKALQAKLQKDNEVYMQQIQVQYDEKVRNIVFWRHFCVFFAECWCLFCYFLCVLLIVFAPFCCFLVLFPHLFVHITNPLCAAQRDQAQAG